MKTHNATLALILLSAAVSRPAIAADLQPTTLRAWKAFLARGDVHLRDRVAGSRPFLWVDESRERADRIRRGEVLVGPLAANGVEGVPHGLIHDWIGAIFIPGAHINDLWSVVHDYDNYERTYKPVVASSKVVACTESHQEFEMVWRRKVLFVNAAMQGHYRAHDVLVDSHRGYSIAESLEVREIEDYGHPGERLLPAGTGNGFIWRIRSVARYEERDGGVYLELEASALTRDIPASLAWMVKPMVNHLSINSLTTTLRQTRDAVAAPRRDPEAAVSCPIPTSLLAHAGGD